jgi:HK97 family phage major capsid protein
VARSVIDSWLIEEQGTDVIRVVTQNSVIESEATPEPMKSYTKTIPRSGAVSVDVIPKGSAYGEDSGTVDEITIVARKFGKVMRIAEEDIEDELVDVLNEKKVAWGNAYAVTIDNACLATNAPSNGTTVPFTSVYQAVRTADTAVGYTADANYIATAGTAAPLTYDELADLVARYEQGPFFDPTQALGIAHPAFKDALRKIKDTQGHPIFVDPIAGNPAQIFGYNLRFSLGAKTNATASNAPTGNPILALGNRSLLRLGKRSGPESVVIDGRDGTSALTDETLLKMRARRGFAVGDVRGWSVLEYLP